MIVSFRSGVTGLWMTHRSTSDWKAASRDSRSIYDQNKQDHCEILGRKLILRLEASKMCIQKCKYCIFRNIYQDWNLVGTSIALLPQQHSGVHLHGLFNLSYFPASHRGSGAWVRLCGPLPQLHRALQRSFHLNQSRNIKQMMKFASDAVTAARFYRLSSEDVSGFCNHGASKQAKSKQLQLFQLRNGRCFYFLWHYMLIDSNFS